MAEIYACSTIIASYKATLGHLETAGSPRELADIELQANQLKQHQAEFRTQFNKATEDLNKIVTVKIATYYEVVLGLSLVAILVIAICIGAYVTAPIDRSSTGPRVHERSITSDTV